MILRFGRFRWNEIPLRILWKESFQKRKREREKALRRDLLGSIMGTWIFGFRNYCRENILKFSNSLSGRIFDFTLR